MVLRFRKESLTTASGCLTRESAHSRKPAHYASLPHEASGSIVGYEAFRTNSGTTQIACVSRALMAIRALQKGVKSVRFIH